MSATAALIFVLLTVVSNVAAVATVVTFARSFAATVLLSLAATGTALTLNF